MIGTKELLLKCLVNRMERKNNIHKFTVFVYGFNDHMECTVDEVMDQIESTRGDFGVYTFHKKSVTIPEMEDGHPLNQNPSEETWELFMDDELKTSFEELAKAKK